MILSLSRVHHWCPWLSGDWERKHMQCREQGKYMANAVEKKPSRQLKIFRFLLFLPLRFFRTWLLCRFEEKKEKRVTEGKKWSKSMFAFLSFFGKEIYGGENAVFSRARYTYEQSTYLYSKMVSLATGPVLTLMWVHLFRACMSIYLQPYSRRKCPLVHFTIEHFSFFLSSLLFAESSESSRGN